MFHQNAVGGQRPSSVWPSDAGAQTGDDPVMDDDELADFHAAHAEVCAEAGIDPLAADALAVLAEAMVAAGVTLH
jgi:hypothetical protein